MTLDLLHNKIIKETLTESFEKSVNDNLIPKLYALYGTSLEGVQFYEDYINDDFIKDGYWYYPLTVVIGGIYAIIWIKWDISVANDFEGGIPYAYVGNGGIDFIIADDVPIAFKKSIEGRDNYFEGGYVKLNVTTDAPNPKILAGKYSQTFVDEMNRQISVAISRACGVKGLPESSIEIDIVFAPNTYMEHTSENVTYRRLLISAKGCSARDFWIKWTRKNSAVAYSVNDNVTSDDIVFELGEDVSQKIREKEYRFLVYGNSDKYRVAMGRKNVTEWRELIKRAVKRGELVKTTAELEENAHVAEVSDKLSEILEKCGVSVPTATSNEIRVDAEVANEALRLAVLGNGESESENYVPEIPKADEEAQAEADVETAVGSREIEAVEEEIPESIAAEATVADEITESIDKNVAEADIVTADNAEETESAEETFEIESVAENGNVAEDYLTDDSVFEGFSDDGQGEFSFGMAGEGFDNAESNVEELTFEDILEEFIPKSDDGELEEPIPEIESVDISDISESESVRFDISKDGGVPFDWDSKDETKEDEELPELEVEIYEDTESDGNEESEEPQNAEEASCDAAQSNGANEEDTATAYAAYDEMSEIAEETFAIQVFEEESNTVEAMTPSYDSEAIVRLENEIASLKHQLEVERIENESVREGLENAITDKKNAEAELNAERDRAAALEGKLHSAEIAKENAENQLNLELLAAADLRAQNEKQKFAIEQVKKLVDEETAAREEAEVHLESLKAEIELLKSENEHLKEVARVSEEACREAEQMCKQHERELLNQIELAEKERVREKNLFAEAARQAKDENEQRLAEFKEAEIARITEEARIVEDERLRLRDELRLENINYAAEEENRKKALEDRAREARLRMEEKARLNAEAKASTSDEYQSPIVPVLEIPVVNEINNEYDTNAQNVENISVAEETIVPSVDEFVPTPAPAPTVNYTYTSYIVRLMFRHSADPNVTARIHEMISYALTDFGKEQVYMKVKASMPDNYTVILNFVKFPKEEFNLLVDIINYLGKSDLGVYKVVLD